MSYLIAVVCSDEAGANAMRARLIRTQRPRLSGLHDAAIVKRHCDGTVDVEQAVDLVGTGTLGGTFWGMLIGLIFFMPSLGLAVGALTGAHNGRFNDIGVDEDFLRAIEPQIKAGQSALLLLLAEDTRDRLLEEVASAAVTVVQTSLSSSQEARLEAIFGL
jgi:uncharacterized membrane protein